MSVKSAMVDMARSVDQTLSGTRVDGESQDVTVYSEWFKCRLNPPTTNERREDSFYQRTRDFTLIAYKTDQAGQPVDVKANMRLEIQSAVFGNDTYEITEEPIPIRSKRKLIMFRMAIRKYDTQDDDD